MKRSYPKISFSSSFFVKMVIAADIAWNTQKSFSPPASFRKCLFVLQKLGVPFFSFLLQPLYQKINKKGMQKQWLDKNSKFPKNRFLLQPLCERPHLKEKNESEEKATEQRRMSLKNDFSSSLSAKMAPETQKNKKCKNIQKSFSQRASFWKWRPLLISPGTPKNRFLNEPLCKKEVARYSR